MFSVYNSVGSDWRTAVKGQRKPVSKPVASSSSISSSSTGSSNTLNSNMSASTGNVSSSALSRNPALYTRRYESSGRKSPVISGQSSSSSTHRSSRSQSDSQTGMHPAARTLNKRASSAERLFPLRSVNPHVSKSAERRDAEARSNYNRSLSVDRYGGAPDPRRLSSSVDYSTRLGLSSSTERLENGGVDTNNHNEYNNTSGGLHSTREISNSNSNIYQNGTSSRVYSSDEVDKIRAQYNQEIQDIKLDYQSRILAKDREWDKKLQASRSELSSSQRMVMDLRQKCNEMAAEYDKSMTELLNDKEQTTQGDSEGGERLAGLTNESIVVLRSERDQYADDLQQVEKSFTELHKRYDKLRETLQSQKKSDHRLKEELADVKQQLRNSAQNFDKLRAESQEKLSKAANEVDKARTSCKSEIIRLQMALKKSEVHAQSAEQQLQQKVAENAELAQICDNLIALKSGNTD